MKFMSYVDEIKKTRRLASRKKLVLEIQKVLNNFQKEITSKKENGRTSGNK